MNIRFISTLTPEDENVMAPAIMKAVASILDVLPIAYMLRIDTSDGQVYHQHSEPKTATLPSAVDPVSPLSMPLQSFDS